MRLVFSYLLLSSCTGAGPGHDTGVAGDWQPVSYADEGEVCFETSGVDLVINVTAPDCLSSSCSRGFQGSCTATHEPGSSSIALTSTIAWEQNVGEGVPCTDDCGLPRVSCTVPALPDGTYTVRFGAEQLELVFPVEAPCSDFR